MGRPGAPDSPDRRFRNLRLRLACPYTETDEAQAEPSRVVSHTGRAARVGGRGIWVVPGFYGECGGPPDRQ